jgi:hypothetical protein
MCATRKAAKLSKPTRSSNHVIGELGEKSLHAALKQWYRQPGDLLEEMVDGFHIDIARRKFLIEIQTANFSSIKNKLIALTEKHHVRLVYPIAQEKWIVRLGADGTTRVGRRKSPKKGNLLHLFKELVRIPDLIKNRNFSLEVLIIREEEIRRDDGLGSWRRKGWSIVDHRFLGVLHRHIFKKPSDFLTLVPPKLSDSFSTQELAEQTNQPRWLAQKMAYCLRKMGAVEVVGKTGNSILYSTKNTIGEQLNPSDVCNVGVYVK